MVHLSRKGFAMALLPLSLDPAANTLPFIKKSLFNKILQAKFNAT